MKHPNFYFWSIFLLLVPTLLVAQPQPVAHYPFDGNALDASGNGNHGTVFGATLTDDRFGNPSSAYEFDGINDYIIYANNNQFMPSLPITVMAWISIEKYGDNHFFWNNWSEDVNRGIWINNPAGSSQAAISFGDGGPVGPTSRRTKFGQMILPLNTWFHLAAVIRGPLDMEVYINGINDCGFYTGSGGNMVYDPAVNGQSGLADNSSNPGSPLQYFKGKLDDLRLFNQALTQTEIQNIVGIVQPVQIDTTICSGEQVQLQGGPGSGTFIWANDPTLSCFSCPNPVATPVDTVTEYRLIRVYSQGCSDTTKFIVRVSELSFTSSSTPVSCAGSSDGQVTASVLVGSPPYEFRLQGGPWQSGNVFSGLGAGTYLLEVRDDSGCEQSTSISIVEPSPLVINVLSVTNPLCHGASDGSVSVAVSGGVGPYTLNGAPPPFTLTGLQAGTQSLTVLDANGCAASESVFLVEPLPLQLSVDSLGDVNCFGQQTGWAQLSATGGTTGPGGTYHFVLGQQANQSGVFDSLFVGIFPVSVTDAQGCVDTAHVQITGPGGLFAEIIDSKEPLCYGDASGSFTVQASGGAGPYEFAIDSLNFSLGNTIGNLPARQWWISIRDGNGCIIHIPALLGQPDSLMLSADLFIGIHCQGDSSGVIRAAGMGGTMPYQYSRDGIVFQADSIVAGYPLGLHQVFVRDANGCVAETSVEVDSLEAIQALATAITPYNGFAIQCPGGEGAANASAMGGMGPYSYVWETGSTGNMVSQLIAGTYQVIVTDSLGCSDTTSVILQEPSEVQTEVFPLTPHNGFAVRCDGNSDGSFSATISGGVTPYRFRIGPVQVSVPVTNLEAGRYALTVLDGNDCVYLSDTVELLAPPPLSILAQITHPTCTGDQDGRIEIQGNGGVGDYLYQWSGLDLFGTSLTGLSSRTYEVEMYDANNCFFPGQWTLTDPDTIELVIDTLMDASCGQQDGYVSLRAIGSNGAPFSYAWQDGSTEGSARGNLAEGTYVVMVWDSLGCESLFDVEIGLRATPIAEAGVRYPDISGPVLESQAAAMQFANESQHAVFYDWSFGDGSAVSTNFEPMHRYPGPGIYTVILTAWDLYRACPDFDTLSFEVIPDGKLYFPNAFTPNGDNINDHFRIQGEGIVSMEVEIYSRWGMVIWRGSGPNMAWDGHSLQGGPAPEGVYVYRVSVTLNDGNIIRRTGDVTLIR